MESTRPKEQLDLHPGVQNSSPRAPYVFSRLAPAKPTEVLEAYWHFAAERQEIFFRRIEDGPPPWTNDTILRDHRFTNAYRAADRTSQYLIRNVIYRGETTPEEVFFRVLLFKLFNRISTWEYLQGRIGQITWREYTFSKFDALLSEAMRNGTPIYSPAYIIPSAHAYGARRKHRNHLRLIEDMMRRQLPQRVVDAPSLREVFELLASFPGIGPFLAFQFTIDLNYSQLVEHSEMSFVVPGPGARDGIAKCFHSLGGLTDAEIIRYVADIQERVFEDLGIAFRNLWGRRLQLIDCQNLFCEIAKYARVAFPDIRGTTERHRIKQRFQPNPRSVEYWFPPKWRINPLAAAQRVDNGRSLGREGGQRLGESGEGSCGTLPSSA